MSSNGSGVLTCNSTRFGDGLLHSAIWVKDPLRNMTKSRYWEVTFSKLKGYAAVGIVEEAKFLSHTNFEYWGYDGGFVTTTRSGRSSIKEGDVVGVSLVRKGDFYHLSFFHNGKEHKYPATMRPDDLCNIYPVVRFQDSGAVTVKRTTEFCPGVHSEIEGEWKLKLLMKNGREQELYDSITVRLEKSDVSRHQLQLYYLGITDSHFYLDQTPDGQWLAGRPIGTTFIGDNGKASLLDSTVIKLFRSLSRLRVLTPGLLLARSKKEHCLTALLVAKSAAFK